MAEKEVGVGPGDLAFKIYTWIIIERLISLMLALDYQVPSSTSLSDNFLHEGFHFHLESAIHGLILVTDSRTLHGDWDAGAAVL